MCPDLESPMCPDLGPPTFFPAFVHTLSVESGRFGASPPRAHSNLMLPTAVSSNTYFL